MVARACSVVILTKILNISRYDQLTSTENSTTCVLHVCCNYYYHQFIGKTHSLEIINMGIISLGKKKNEKFF